ncbi:unnamed protein product [Moneuplotes crassus]|uniref:PH domain-containing protein n=1 Tax=Euplotes crassus TaxID=5936 RepID=A0AAD1XZW9_EUPCR|nr:unnamed protein product [Moneuplotes crassus]
MEPTGHSVDPTEIDPSGLSAEEIEKEGWLYKESRFWKVWRKRWCVLTKKNITFGGKTMPASHSWLFTFDSENWQTDGKPPTEKICLGLCRTVKSIEDEVNKDYAFKIDVDGTPFRFQAESFEAKEHWIGSLGRAMIKKTVMLDKQMDNLPDFL